MLLAQALLRAAIKKVAVAGGVSLLEDGRMRLKVSNRKKVSAGLRVRISEAEYPVQKPATPFCLRISRAISAVEGAVTSWGDVLCRPELGEDGGDCAFNNAAACFFVTIFATGVVRSFVRLPAMKPIVNSSMAVRMTGDDFLLRVIILLWRRKLYARKKRNESAIVFPVSCKTPA